MRKNILFLSIFLVNLLITLEDLVICSKVSVSHIILPIVYCFIFQLYKKNK